MDFLRLPDPVFLQILGYLSMKDQLRVGRVSKSFRRASLIVVSNLKWLQIWGKLGQMPDCFSSLLNYCSNSVETIEFSYGAYNGLPIVKTLANYSCSKLTNLHIEVVSIGSDILGTLLKNNPSLERLLVRTTPHLKFPLRLVCHNLKILQVMPCNSNSFHSMTGRLPNLQRFEAWVAAVSVQSLDNFFASCPKLDELSLHFTKNKLDFNRLTHFWKLESLENLNLYDQEPFMPCLDDPGFKKIGESFPKLTVLNVDFVLISTVGIKALSGLENLKSLRFGEHARSFYELDDVVPNLAKLTQLEWARFEDAVITPTTLIALFQSLPKLRRLRICEISDLELDDEVPEDDDEDIEEGSKAAVALLESLGNAGKPRIVIEFSTRDGEFYTIWDNDMTMNALKHLCESHGVMIYLTWDRWNDIYYRKPGEWP